MGEILVCNIAKKKFEPNGFKIRRSYNYNDMWIRPCEENEPYTTYTIRDQMDVKLIHTEYDAAKAERIPIKITAEEIRNDFFSNEKLTEKGCFVPAGPVPTEQELANAHATRRAYLEECVNNGNIEYSRSGRVDDIPGVWKRACIELGVQTEWAFMAPPAMFDCPSCGDRLKAGVAVCKSCGAILDRAKAEKFGLVQPAEEQPKPAANKKREVGVSA